MEQDDLLFKIVIFSWTLVRDRHYLLARPLITMVWNIVTMPNQATVQTMYGHGRLSYSAHLELVI